MGVPPSDTAISVQRCGQIGLGLNGDVTQSAQSVSLGLARGRLGILAGTVGPMLHLRHRLIDVDHAGHPIRLGGNS